MVLHASEHFTAAQWHDIEKTWLTPDLCFIDIHSRRVDFENEDIDL